jgi:hypothetical protein
MLLHTISLVTVGYLVGRKTKGKERVVKRSRAVSEDMRESGLVCVDFGVFRTVLSNALALHVPNRRITQCDAVICTEAKAL